MDTLLVLDEKRTNIGEYIGICRWYHSTSGYGFIMTMDDNYKNYDLYVNSSLLRPSSAEQPRLYKGEYVQFDIRSTPKGPQAYNVTGIKGGPLMCDILHFPI